MYELIKSRQYLVKNIETDKTQIMEWRGITFRDVNNDQHYLSNNVAVREARKDELVFIPKTTRRETRLKRL